MLTIQVATTMTTAAQINFTKISSSIFLFCFSWLSFP